MIPTSSAPRPIVVRDLLLLVLAACGGALDAVSYLNLHAFSANMTGNTILFALGVSGVHPDQTAPAGTAIGAFFVGAFTGAAAGAESTDDDPWPRAVRRPMLLEVAAIAAFAACWTGLGDGPGRRLILLGLGAFAMGVQSGVTHDVHRGGASTTYMTGTVARTAEFFADVLRLGFRGGLLLNAVVWAVYLAAAVGVGVVAQEHRPLQDVAWALAGVVLVVAIVGPIAVRRAQPASRP